MRVISRKRLKEFWTVREQRDSMGPLQKWNAVVRLAAWKSPVDVKEHFGKRVDFVQTTTKKNTLAVFDIAANKYRLIAAIHYLASRPEKGRVYVLHIMTHEEYDEERWKEIY